MQLVLEHWPTSCCKVDSCNQWQTPARVVVQLLGYAVMSLGEADYLSSGYLGHHSENHGLGQ